MCQRFIVNDIQIFPLAQALDCLCSDSRFVLCGYAPAAFWAWANCPHWKRCYGGKRENKEVYCNYNENGGL